MQEIWQSLIVIPILNIIILLAGLTGYLSVAIVIMTVAMRLLLLPLVLPSIRSMKKQRELQPELEKIKKKYKNDKKKQAEAQMELFKEHGLNPASGCLSQLPMLVILFALFGAIRMISNAASIVDLNSYLYFNPANFDLANVSTNFFVWDLTTPDPYHVLPIISGALQLVVSKMTFSFTTKAQKVAKKTPDKSDDMAYNMQKQMLYIMPLITVMISWNLPAGAVLYIITTTLFMMAQTYFMLGKEDIKV